MTIQEPTVNEFGDDTHPAFGSIRASRTSCSPGAVLYDSDIRHAHTVRLTISRATRKRDLSSDWHHTAKELIEVEMSEAQWASFVSSMNTEGVPCTIRHTETEWGVPGLPYAPRMAQSMVETREAADRAWATIREKLDAYVAHKTAANLRALQAAVDNATANVAFAGKMLVEHTENVVQRARADIEAMVTTRAAQLGLTAGDLTTALALPAGEDDLL